MPSLRREFCLPVVSRHAAVDLCCRCRSHRPRLGRAHLTLPSLLNLQGHGMPCPRREFCLPFVSCHAASNPAHFKNRRGAPPVFLGSYPPPLNRSPTLDVVASTH